MKTNPSNSIGGNLLSAFGQRRKSVSLITIFVLTLAFHAPIANASPQLLPPTLVKTNFLIGELIKVSFGFAGDAFRPGESIEVTGYLVAPTGIRTNVFSVTCTNSSFREKTFNPLNHCSDPTGPWHVELTSKAGSSNSAAFWFEHPGPPVLEFPGLVVSQLFSCTNLVSCEGGTVITGITYQTNTYYGTNKIVFASNPEPDADTALNAHAPIYVKTRIRNVNCLTGVNCRLNLALSGPTLTNFTYALPDLLGFSDYEWNAAFPADQFAPGEYTVRIYANSENGPISGIVEKKFVVGDRRTLSPPKNLRVERPE